MNDWVLEITPRTYYDYFNNKSINIYLNYETDFIRKWKNIPHNLFVSFVEIKEVITINPQRVFIEIQNHFKKHNIVTHYYENSSHSYVKNGSQVIFDIIDFIKSSEIK